MKIVLLHGDNVEASRKRFAQIVSGVKKKGWETAFISKEDKYSLPERLTMNSLFEENTLFVVEKASALADSELKWLSGNEKDYSASLLIYSGKLLPKTVLNAFPKSTNVEIFETPRIIFKFLDSIFPGNSRIAVSMLDQLLDTQAREFVLAMLARHLRDLYWAFDGAENMGGPSWRIGKLKTQALRLGEDRIKKMIISLSDIDKMSKTSDIDTRLLLEMLLIENLANE